MEVAVIQDGAAADSLANQDGAAVDSLANQDGAAAADSLANQVRRRPL
jgi:hypothetical protein